MQKELLLAIRNVLRVKSYGLLEYCRNDVRILRASHLIEAKTGGLQ